jgi:hypothetical protein
MDFRHIDVSCWVFGSNFGSRPPLFSAGWNFTCSSLLLGIQLKLEKTAALGNLF